MDLYRNTKSSLQHAGRRPKKHMGQNFLIDLTVLDAIIEASELSRDDIVLEIGAGTGILTERLARPACRVIAVELDDELFRILQLDFRDNTNIILCHADILDLNLSTLINTYANLPGSKTDPKVKIISNLPYYITTPILMKILEESSLLPIQMVLVMVQAEVGLRMVAVPGTKDYGALSVAIAYRSDARIIKHVPAESFYPKPKVDSTLVKLDIRHIPPVEVKDEKIFFQIVKTCFQYRRKTLRNAISIAINSGALKCSINSLDMAFQSLNLDPIRRGETLSITEFADLSNSIAGKVTSDE